MDIINIPELRNYIVAAGGIATAAVVLAKLRGTCRAFAAEYRLKPLVSSATTVVLCRLRHTCCAAADILAPRAPHANGVLVAGPIIVSMMNFTMVGVMYDGLPYRRSVPGSDILYFDTGAVFNLSVAEYTNITRLFGLPLVPYYTDGRAGTDGHTAMVERHGTSIIVNKIHVMIPYKSFRGATAYHYDRGVYFYGPDIGNFSNLRRLWYVE